MILRHSLVNRRNTEGGLLLISPVRRFVAFVGICDVDTQHPEDSAGKIKELQGKRPQVFKDYKKLLAMSELQAVIIAAPPHWHALPFLAALDRGLDIYCEKPLAYDIRDGQAMVAAAGKSDRIVQVGFQRRQSPAVRQAREDADAQQIAGNRRARAMMKRDYRTPWQHPYQGQGPVFPNRFTGF